ncbi:MAG: DUF4160 domain-containing protein [Tepidiformaceae bacterium]
MPSRACHAFANSRVERFTWYHHEHLPPHFHAVYGGISVRVDFLPEIVFVGDFPRRQSRLVREWARAREQPLAENWGLATKFQTLKRIEPLA